MVALPSDVPRSGKTVKRKLGRGTCQVGVPRRIKSETIVAGHLHVR